MRLQKGEQQQPLHQRRLEQQMEEQLVMVAPQQERQQQHEGMRREWQRQRELQPLARPLPATWNARQRSTWGAGFCALDVRH